MIDLVSQGLCDVSRLPSLRLSEWDLLIRQARSADLLPRLAVLIEEAGLTESIPPAPRRHLLAARIVSSAQAAEVTREAEQIRRTLGSLRAPPIFLKGAAYLLADLPAAKGRVFSDIDVLLPKALLNEVESTLMLAGWATTHHEPYDQRYYRKWMHELPPFQHMQRGTTLDVHHGILPETARSHPDSAKLINDAVPAARDTRVRVLCPIDMVLHSMTHLFHNEELSHGLRDLSDIDLLLRAFGGNDEFWNRLLNRAEVLDLRRPLYYGLRYAHRILSSPVPDRVLAQIDAWAPRWPLRPIMDGLWMRALRPRHKSASDIWTPSALFLLYVRAHWLRMPPLLLVYHLAVKSLRRQRPESDDATA